MNQQEIDQLDDEQKQKEFKLQSTELQAFFNFIKAMIGIGIISLPYVSYKIGWLWSLFLLGPVLFCVTRSNQFLIQVADDLHATGLLYSDCARVIYGGVFPYIVDTALVLNQIGICIAYLLFFTYFLKQEAENFGLELQRFYFFIIAFLFLLPLSLIKNIHFFHQSSTTGFALGVFSFFAITIEAISQYIGGEPIKYEKPIDVERTFLYFGIAIFSFEGIQAMLPIRDSMINRFKFMKVFYLVIFFAFLFAVIVQQSTILIFGEETQQLVLFNFRNERIRSIVTLSYLISLLLTYPIQFFVIVQIVERELLEQPYSQLSPSEIMDLQVSSNHHQIFVNDWTSLNVRIFFTAFIFGVAYLIPDFAAFLNFLGGFFGSCIQYVFPVMLHMKRFWNSRKDDRPYFSYAFILLVSVLAIVLGTYESFTEMMASESE